VASRLDGQVALITGGASGMGAASARLFASEGARVAIADVAGEPGRALADEIGENATYLHLDVTSEGDWAAGIDRITGAFGRLDVLLNNAGILKFSPLAGTSLEDYMQVIRVNQVGVFLGMRAAIQPMIAAGGGSIINVSSIEGLFGGPFLVAYAASKFAVRGMTKVAAVELGRFGIRVNSIHPGGIETPMVTGLPGIDPDMLTKTMGRAVPLQRMGQAEEVARLSLFLASNESSYCSGSEFVADGAASAYIRWPGLEANPAARAP